MIYVAKFEFFSKSLAKNKFSKNDFQKIGKIGNLKQKQEENMNFSKNRKNRKNRKT